MADRNRQGGRGITRFIDNVGEFLSLQGRRLYEPARVMGEVRKGNITPNDPEFYTGAQEAAGAAMGGGAFTGGVGAANIGYRESLKRLGRGFRAKRQEIQAAMDMGSIGRVEGQQMLSQLGDNYMQIQYGLKATPEIARNWIRDIEVRSKPGSRGSYVNRTVKVTPDPQTTTPGTLPHEFQHGFQDRLGAIPGKEAVYLPQKMQDVWLRNKMLRQVRDETHRQGKYKELYDALPSELEADAVARRVINQAERTGEQVSYRDYVDIIDEVQKKWVSAMAKTAPKQFKRLKADMAKEARDLVAAQKFTKNTFNDLAKNRFNKSFDELSEGQKQRVRLEAYKERQEVLKRMRFAPRQEDMDFDLPRSRSEALQMGPKALPQLRRRYKDSLKKQAQLKAQKKLQEYMDEASKGNLLKDAINVIEGRYSS